MSSSLVTIVIPCFNAERWVGDAVRSCLEQRHAETEIIVVDDGSTDKSREILAGFGDRIRVEAIANSGPSRARNVGLAAARGSFIQFLDADDLLAPDKLSASLPLLSAGVDAVVSSKSWFDDGASPRRPILGKALRKAFRAREMRWAPERQTEYVLRYPVGTPGPLHRIEAVHAVGGFREDIRNHEDIEFHFRLSTEGARFERLHRALVYCRHHASPGRLRRRPERYDDILRALEAMSRQADRAGVSDPRVWRALADRYAITARKLLRLGDDERADAALSVARRMSRFPRPTGVPLYNALCHLFGLTRTERVLMRAEKLVGRSTGPG